MKENKESVHMTALNADGSSKSKVLLTSILFMGLSHIIIRETHIKNMYWKPHILTG